MPCQYTVEPLGKQFNEGCDKNFFIGDQVVHKWNCSAGWFLNFEFNLELLNFRAF